MLRLLLIGNGYGGYILRSCFDLIACIRSTFGNGCILSRFFSFILTSNKFTYSGASVKRVAGLINLQLCQVLTGECMNAEH
jgi:hypothetical protein